MPKAAPTRPRPTITRTRAGQPPRATNGASQALPPASARQRFCCAVSACRQTSAAPAQAKATGRNSWERIPRPLLCMNQISPMPSAPSARAMPQSIRRLAGAWSRMPLRDRGFQTGSVLGGRGWHQQPERAVGDHADELEGHHGHEGDPHHHHRPAQMPGQSGADSAEPGALGDPGGPLLVRGLFRAVRRRGRETGGVAGEGESAGPRVDSGTSPMARKVSAVSGRAFPATGSTRLESVVVMISPASHGSDGATSRVLPEISLKKRATTATTSFRFRRSHNSGELWGSSLMVRG